MNPLLLIVQAIARPQRPFSLSNKQALIYLVVLLLINTLLSGIIFLVSGANQLAAIGIGVIFFTGLLGTVSMVAWVAVWILVLRKRVATAFPAVVVGSTPLLLIGWLTLIPGTILLKVALVVWNFLLLWTRLRFAGFSQQQAWFVTAGSGLVGFGIFYGIAQLILTGLPIV